MMHAQTVCTRPFLILKGPGNNATLRPLPSVQSVACAYFRKPATSKAISEKGSGQMSIEPVCQRT